MIKIYNSSTYNKIIYIYVLLVKIFTILCYKKYIVLFLHIKNLFEKNIHIFYGKQ